jgi:hypothetical protein
LPFAEGVEVAVEADFETVSAAVEPAFAVVLPVV